MSDHRAGIPRRDSGQGIVEFALILPLLLVFIFGIIEFGRLLFVYSAVITASREAARYGSAAGDNGSGTLRFRDCDGMIAAARRVGILANITAVSISYDSGPGTALVSANCPPGAGVIEGGRHRVIIEIVAGYRPVVPLINIGTFNLRSRSTRTIYNNIEVGRFPRNPAHIADLDGLPSANAHPNKWDARVDISVLDEEGSYVENATVMGLWSGHPSSSGTCVTNGSGLCSVSKDGINRGPHHTPATITFTIIDIIHIEKTYDPSANIDPDGDSDGTQITLTEPP